MADPAPLVFAFNGDADGLCAQHIYGLVHGSPALRITGWKRDLLLLARVPLDDFPAGARVRVFDISLDQNKDALPAALARPDVDIEWYDHHEPGNPAPHPRLALHINQAPGLCSAVITDQALGRRHRDWAALAAYGDNLPATAEGILKDAGIDAVQGARLARAGVLLNYNAYGERPGDVLYEPVDLAVRMAPFRSALDFCGEASVFGPLQQQFETDQARFQGLDLLADSPKAVAYRLPDQPWARRYGATWANEQALLQADRALAILHDRGDGSHVVSIRSPRLPGAAVPPASDLAREFPTGGGRKLAAGINRLDPSDLERFLARFVDYYA